MDEKQPRTQVFSRLSRDTERRLQEGDNLSAENIMKIKVQIQQTIEDQKEQRRLQTRKLLSKLNQEKLKKQKEEAQRHTDIKNFLQQIRSEHDQENDNENVLDNIKTHPSIDKFLSSIPKTKIGKSIKKQYFDLVQESLNNNKKVMINIGKKPHPQKPLRHLKILEPTLPPKTQQSRSNTPIRLRFNETEESDDDIQIRGQGCW